MNQTQSTIESRHLSITSSGSTLLRTQMVIARSRKGDYSLWTVIRCRLAFCSPKFATKKTFTAWGIASERTDFAIGVTLRKQTVGPPPPTSRIGVFNKVWANFGETPKKLNFNVFCCETDGFCCVNYQAWALRAPNPSGVCARCRCETLLLVGPNASFAQCKESCTHKAS